MEELTETAVSRRMEIKETKKIMAIIGVFFCCNSFTAFMSIISFLFFSEDVNARLNFTQVSDLLVATNSCMTIFIYGSFDTKFRTLFFQIFCPCFQNAKEPGIINPRKKSATASAETIVDMK